jgi:hypothetical protein
MIKSYLTMCYLGQGRVRAVAAALIAFFLRLAFCGQFATYIRVRQRTPVIRGTAHGAFARTDEATTLGG